VLTYAFSRNPGRRNDARCSRNSKIAAPTSSTAVNPTNRTFLKGFFKLKAFRQGMVIAQWRNMSS
jgi:hypothetical protein